MSRIYYRGAKAAVLCFDLTDGESFDKARYWSGELERNEPVSKPKNKTAESFLEDPLSEML